MAVFGLPYVGSKSRFAEGIVSCLPTGGCLVDLFAGGCAVGHAGLVSGRFGCVVVNDVSDSVVLFGRAVRGELAGWFPVLSRDEFEVSCDFGERLLYSFGNDCESYLWGRDVEGVKVAVSRMLVADSLVERRRLWGVVLRELGVFLSKGEGLERLQRLQGLQGLERLQGLQGLERLQDRLVISQKDYREVDIPDGAVVYCDPPYCDTSDRYVPVTGGVGFDYGEFLEWVHSRDFPVFLSDRRVMEGMGVVEEFRVRDTMSATGNSSMVSELLMVQERFVDDFRAGLF